MATNFSGIKQIIDVPSWQQASPVLTSAHVTVASTAGGTLVGDRRASQFKQNLLWFLNGGVLYHYRTRGNGWTQMASPSLAGVFGAGASAVYAPSHGPRGTIAAGATTTSVTLSTALPAAVGANSLVNQRIRIIGNNAGGSGLTQERTIVANTSGTTPIIYLNSALTFTPASGAAYEILSGRVYLLSAGTVAAGTFKFYDVATNSYSGNLATTNLPATISTSSTFIALDELHTPITGVGGVAINGECGGYFGTLTATGSSGTTLTGQAASGDSAVLANEYRNFQIRIVQDTTTPTAVGQRRRITSHTAGASPVYTVPTWTVTPSSNAQYVIENNNDLLLWTSALTATHRYEWISNTWDTTTYAAAPAAMAAGSVAFHPFGTVLNAGKTIRHSYIYKFRGSGVTLDVFDIAGAATGSWIPAWVYDNSGQVVFGTGASSAYSVVDNKCMVIPAPLTGVTPQSYYFDVDANSLRSYAPVPQVSSTVVDGDRMAVDIFVDGTDKKAFFYHIPSTINQMLRTLFIN